MAKSWVNKQLDAEHWKLRLMLLTIAIMAGAFALGFAYYALMPWLYGVARLDSAEKLDRFVGRGFPCGELVYETSFGEVDGFSIVSTSQHELGLMGGGYISAPIGTTTSETHYRVWLLKGSDYFVIYCTEGELKDTGSVTVDSEHQDLSAEVIADYAADRRNVYVLYDAGTPVPTLTIIAVLAIGSALLLLLRNSRLLRGRTLLARQLATMNDPGVTAELNRQAAEPVLESGGVSILRDWLFVREYQPMLGNNGYRSGLVPLSDVENLTITPDPDDKDEFSCAFSIRGATRPVSVYMDAKNAKLLAAWWEAKQGAAPIGIS